MFLIAITAEDREFVGDQILNVRRKSNLIKLQRVD